MHAPTNVRAHRRRRRLAASAVLVAACVAAVTAPSLAAVAGAKTPSVTEVGSTVPPNGDLNPYGVAVVPKGAGHLRNGDVLVSNFNNGAGGAGGQQGRGTTIVDLDPRHTPAQPRLFARITPGSVSCPGGIGLTTALAVLPGGLVVVGSLPTTDGAQIAGPGCLIFLSSRGVPVGTLSGAPINGPWDMTTLTSGHTAALFVTNVLNGLDGANSGTPMTESQGTVARIILDLQGDQPPTVSSEDVIGSGFTERTDPAALVIGPTGLALGGKGTLYVNDTANSAVVAIPDALTRTSSVGTGTVLSSGGNLNQPLGLAVEHNGDLLAANGGDGNIVKVTPAGAQVVTIAAAPAGAGSLFGLAVDKNRVFFVDDSENQLNLLGR
ncbi:MAG TPA: hypothetical protein VFH70_13830 [Acidimicrobiales bacterium]|nr:hypothetical protein [Acidimicrobiales bacterium]